MGSTESQRIRQSPDGGVWIISRWRDSLNSTINYFTFSYADSTGDVKFSKRIDYQSDPLDGEEFRICALNDGNAVLYCRDNTSSSRVLKISSAGSVIWYRQLSGGFPWYRTITQHPATGNIILKTNNGNKYQVIDVDDGSTLHRWEVNENLSPPPERGEVVTFGDNGNYFSIRFNDNRIFITVWDAPLDNHLGTWTFDLLNGREPDAIPNDYAPLGIVVMDSSVGGNLLIGFETNGPAYFIELEMTNGLPTGNVLRFFSLVHDVVPVGTPTSNNQTAGFLMQRKPDGSIIVAGRAVGSGVLQQAFFTFNATATCLLYTSPSPRDS